LDQKATVVSNPTVISNTNLVSTPLVAAKKPDFARTDINTIKRELEHASISSTPLVAAKKPDFASTDINTIKRELEVAKNDLAKLEKISSTFNSNASPTKMVLDNKVISPGIKDTVYVPKQVTIYDQRPTASSVAMTET
jgi:hypothetical protein